MGARARPRDQPWGRSGGWGGALGTGRAGRPRRGGAGGSRAAGKLSLPGGKAFEGEDGGCVPVWFSPDVSFPSGPGASRMRGAERRRRRPVSTRPSPHGQPRRAPPSAGARPDGPRNPVPFQVLGTSTQTRAAGPPASPPPGTKGTGRGAGPFLTPRLSHQGVREMPKCVT